MGVLWLTGANPECMLSLSPCSALDLSGCLQSLRLTSSFPSFKKKGRLVSQSR